MTDTTIAVIIVIVSVAALLFGALMLDRSICYARWEYSGMPVSWGIQGCMLEQPDGIWIPSSAYRVIAK